MAEVSLQQRKRKRSQFYLAKVIDTQYFVG